jgi:hypothetical protein
LRKIDGFIVRSKEGFMRSKGISGFGIIVLIIILLLLGYVGYQIFRVHFTKGKIDGKVKTTAEIGPSMTDETIVEALLEEARDSNVKLNPDSIFVDRGIPDSFRIYVAYDDSSNIFGFFTYKQHFVIDRTVKLKVQF